MPRDVPVGNGNLLVAFGKDYLLRELYFPHVGQERHTGDDPFRFGVWVDGQFEWVPSGWHVRRDYLGDSLVTRVEMTHDAMKLKLTSHDWVDFHENVFLRKLVIANLSDEEVEVRLFFCHDFRVSGNDIGDTAAYRPEVKGLLHYKGDRYFLVNVFANDKAGIDAFATGNKEPPRLLGSWKDAEDGVLSGNPIAQGTVDSVAAVHLKLGAKASDECFYWICAGTSWQEVQSLNGLVLAKGPEKLLKRTRDYWSLWANKEEFDTSMLPERVAWLYRRSLLVARTQIDNSGAIVAANDSDVVRFNRDTYSYVWPRDGALTAYALDLAGYANVTRSFFDFCGRVIDPRGYFLHKYTPSGALASSWHPWLKDGRPQLPIQEDETALVVWALWRHFDRNRDIEFIKPLYKPLIRSAADFMMSYRDQQTRLPLPSYDLWEERQGVLTFTCSAVHGGLTAAASFARAFGETDVADEYLQGASELRQAMDQHLYLKDKGRFARMINLNAAGGVDVDDTVDASLYGVFAFGAYPVADDRVASTMEQVRNELWCRTHVGGLARYVGDSYHRVSGDVPGNPWFVTTLWLAQYYIALAKSRMELHPALEILEWVAARALPSGVLAEQVDPFTDEPLSVSPLTWSHATFVATVHQYVDKSRNLERCPTCGQPVRASQAGRRGHVATAARSTASSKKSNSSCLRACASARPSSMSCLQNSPSNIK